MEGDNHMLIQALCDYAAKQEPSDTPDGWQEQKIHYRIELSPEGDIVRITDVRTENKISEKITKYEPEIIKLPTRVQTTNQILANIIEHRPVYLFGINYDSKTASFTTEDKTGKAAKSHQAFVEQNLKICESLTSDICKAYCNFLKKWTPADMTENTILTSLGKEYGLSAFGFCLEGLRDYLEDDSQIKDAYNTFYEKQKQDTVIDEEQIVTCSILGEKLPAARTHNRIKFPGGNPSGSVLVGINENAFESYGKTQSFNSNISEKAMQIYTSTLNKLLSDKNHHKIINDMVIVYFAMKTDDTAECNLFNEMWGIQTDNIADGQTANQQNKKLNDLFTAAKGGGITNTDTMIDPNTTFYIIGLTPNSARICQKFFCKDTFGNIIQNLAQHQNDLCINEKEKRNIYFSQIAKELISPKAKDASVPPPLMTNIMLAAMQGTNYPPELLSTVITRIKTDHDEKGKPFIKLNATRAGIIKACLNRKARLSHRKEEITMSWNETNENPAYACGALFAVYEKMQRDVSGDLNRTIKDTYFTSACSHPAVIMPRLEKLSQAHIHKMSTGQAIYYQRLIADLMDKISSTGFPATLSMDNQGQFIIGYYQMNKKLYTKKETKETN